MIAGQSVNWSCGKSKEERKERGGVPAVAIEFQLVRPALTFRCFPHQLREVGPDERRQRRIGFRPGADLASAAAQRARRRPHRPPSRTCASAGAGVAAAWPSRQRSTRTCTMASSRRKPDRLDGLAAEHLIEALRTCRMTLRELGADLRFEAPAAHGCRSGHRRDQCARSPDHRPAAPVRRAGRGC
jgi:hypothetical protein